jgi:hypothetical protein
MVTARLIRGSSDTTWASPKVPSDSGIAVTLPTSQTLRFNDEAVPRSICLLAVPLEQCGLRTEGFLIPRAAPDASL